MATEIELRAQLASIDRAIASGALTVKHGDTLVTYRSMSDLLAARGFILGQLAALDGKPRYRAVRVYPETGY